MDRELTGGNQVGTQGHATSSSASAAQETSSSRHPMSHVRARIIEGALFKGAAPHESMEHIVLAAASTALVIAKEWITEAQDSERGNLNNRQYLGGLEAAEEIMDLLLADLLVERPPRQESEQTELMRAPTTDRASIADPRVELSGESMPHDEEMIPHPFTSRTPYEPGDDRDIWCKDCEYHRDHAIHQPDVVATEPRPNREK